MRNALLALLLFSSCAATAQDALQLVQKESVIEEALQEQIYKLGPYAEEHGETIHELIEVKKEMGKVAEALDLYEDLISNIRINHGLNAIDQIQYIEEMIDIYFANPEYRENNDIISGKSAIRLADEWLDLAKHLATRHWKDDDASLSTEYASFIRIRFGMREETSPFEHECWNLDNRDEERYESYSVNCSGYRLDRVEHFIKAVVLQKELVHIIEGNVNDDGLWCGDFVINDTVVDDCADLRIQLTTLRDMASLVNNLIWRMKFPGEMAVRTNSDGSIDFSYDYRDHRIHKYNPRTYRHIIQYAENSLDKLPVLD